MRAGRGKEKTAAMVAFRVMRCVASVVREIAARCVSTQSVLFLPGFVSSLTAGTYGVNPFF